MQNEQCNVTIILTPSADESHSENRVQVTHLQWIIHEATEVRMLYRALLAGREERRRRGEDDRETKVRSRQWEGGRAGIYAKRGWPLVSTGAVQWQRGLGAIEIEIEIVLSPRASAHIYCTA